MTGTTEDIKKAQKIIIKGDRFKFCVNVKN